MLGNRGEYDKAIADLNEAVRLDPKDNDAHFDRGWVFLDQKKYPEAVAEFDQAIQLKPEDSKNFRERGKAWAFQGEHTQAAADLSQAIKLNPKDSESYSYRGWAWKKMREFAKALADLDEAIRLDANDANATRAGHGSSLPAPREAAERERGREAATISCRLTHGTNRSTRLAAAYAETGDFELAVKWKPRPMRFTPKRRIGKTERHSFNLTRRKSPTAMSSLSNSLLTLPCSRRR